MALASPRRVRPCTDATRMVGAGVDATEPRPHLFCLGCHERYIMALPMNVTMAVATIKAFVKMHRACRAPAILPPQDTTNGQ